MIARYPPSPVNMDERQAKITLNFFKSQKISHKIFLTVLIQRSASILKNY